MSNIDYQILETIYDLQKDRSGGISCSEIAEELGLDSLIVRDHLREMNKRYVAVTFTFGGGCGVSLLAGGRILIREQRGLE